MFHCQCVLLEPATAIGNDTAPLKVLAMGLQKGYADILKLAVYKPEILVMSHKKDIVHITVLMGHDSGIMNDMDRIAERIYSQL